MRKDEPKIVLDLVFHQWSQDREGIGYFHLHLEALGAVLLQEILYDLGIKLTCSIGEWVNSLRIWVQVIVILDNGCVDKVLEGLEKIKLHVIVSLNESL